MHKQILNFIKLLTIIRPFSIEQSILASPLTDYLDTQSFLLSYSAVNNTIPSFVLSERGEGDWGHFHFGAAYNSVTLRDFNTKIPGDAQIVDKDYAIHAWAVNASGTINMPRGQLLQYYATYDQGLTGYTADLNGSLEYVLSVNKDGSVELVPSYGWVLAYKIPWSDKFFTQVSTSMLTVDWSRFDSPSEIANGNVDIENALDKKMKQTFYATVNLVWQPAHGFSNGIEYVYGTRENRDGKLGVANRVHLVARVNI